MSEVNTVLLSTAAFAQIKNENCKYKLLLDNLLSQSTLSENRERLEFDSEKVRQAIEFVYLEEYRKRLSTAKTQATRYQGRELSQESGERSKKG